MRLLHSACCASEAKLHENDNEERSIPRKVLTELSLMGCLLASLVIDLRAEWAPFITASDGAESFGYGGVTARCDPSVTRTLAAHSRTVPHVFYPTEATHEAVDGDSFPGKPVRMPISLKEFTTTFSLKSDSGLHASKLEMGALCLSLKVIVRKRRWHNTRLFALVDSQALLHAVRKGRSGAHNFWHGTRVLASMLLACELHLHTGYTPSKWNPSDGASRGVHDPRLDPEPRTIGDGGESSRPVRSLQALHSTKRSYRRIVACGTMPGWTTPPWSSSCSSSRLEQPST